MPSMSVLVVSFHHSQSSRSGAGDRGRLYNDTSRCERIAKCVLRLDHRLATQICPFVATAGGETRNASLAGGPTMPMT